MLVLAATLVFSGCATSLKSVNMKKEAMGPTPQDSLSLMYCKTYFQERFMGRSIGTAIVFGPLVGAVLWHSIADYEDRTAARLESSEYEKLLGDFDVSDYFFGQLNQNLTSSRYIEFVFTEDADTSQKVLEFVKCDSPRECAIIDETIKERFSCVTALKMAYGMGARQGNEQYGFAKSYRPFIRLVGITRSLDATNEVLWREDILVFGDKRYRGSDGRADRIDREELIITFKDLTSEAITLLLQSLNAEQLADMPILVDTTRADLQF